MLQATSNSRTGAVAPMAALLLVPMLALVALCVDYGYLLVVRTDLQRCADASALAAVRDLVPDPFGNQDLDEVRATVRQYAAENVNGTFTVRDADIEIGRYDPSAIYTGVTILDTGVYDTVRVTLRRDALANTPVSLFFARVIGITESEVTATATAVLQKAASLPPGSDILPIGIRQSSWESQDPGDSWSIYGDGRMLDNNGSLVPGNWGTLDIGLTSNSTADLSDQILNGLRQEDLDALYSAGSIPSSVDFESTHQMWINADTGFSAGMKDAIKSSHGLTKLVPIYDVLNEGGGNNLEFHIVGWGVVEITSSYWNGGQQHKHVTVTKGYMYDGDLRAHPDLSNTTEVIEAAYTAPVLVE